MASCYLRQIMLLTLLINGKTRQSLDKLKKLVSNKVIVICKSDKDGELLILNMSDNQAIMERELVQFESLPLNSKTINAYLDNIRHSCEKYVVELHRHGAISDKRLLHSIGTKENNGIYQHISGVKAKYFNCNETAYAHPLFKTHKIKPEELATTNVFNIPVRLLQSAGKITTSRVTTTIESILQPISAKFCQSDVNKYCKDSKKYITELLNWQNREGLYVQAKLLNSGLHIVAADVKGLYPNLNRSLVMQSLIYALKRHSKFEQRTADTLVQLTLFCLNNIITQHGQNYYTQTNGIVTGDNHSVLLAIGGGTGGAAWAKAHSLLFLGGAAPTFFLNIVSLSKTISIGSSEKVNRPIKKKLQNFSSILSILFPTYYL